MSSIVYKVIFKGSRGNENQFLTLTFKDISFHSLIKIPSHYFSSIKKISEKSESVVNFQNIEEVILIGDNDKKYVFNYYLILLYSNKMNSKKHGFLIGNVKKVGDILIGIWPFTESITDITTEKIFKKLPFILFKTIWDLGLFIGIINSFTTKQHAK